MTTATARLATLILLAMPVAGCSSLLPGPPTYASLRADTAAVDEPAGGDAAWTPEPEAVVEEGAPVPGSVYPASTLRRSEAATARWVRDPGSRRSLAATLAVTKPWMRPTPRPPEPAEPEAVPRQAW